MRSYEFLTVDVFTDQRFGGNPLAVFPHADGLSASEMQAIAKEFSYSETTFVLPPADPAHTARVRIFTPAHEMPFAGHPNVGTGFVLARLSATRVTSMVFEEIAGLVDIQILSDAMGAPLGARIAAPLPLSIGDAIDTDQIAACVSLTADDIVTTTHTPLRASVGVDFIIVELRDMEALLRARPNITALQEMAADDPDLGTRSAVHVYVVDPVDPTKLATRMFAPLTNVYEDPATGSANAALAALLTSHASGEEVELAFDIVQGVEMGRPSRLLATARKGPDGVFATVAGNCVSVLRGTLEL